MFDLPDGYLCPTCGVRPTRGEYDPCEACEREADEKLARMEPEVEESEKQLGF